MNYLAAMLLLVLGRGEEEEAFWVLASLIDDEDEGECLPACLHWHCNALIATSRCPLVATVKHCCAAISVHTHLLLTHIQPVCSPCLPHLPAAGILYKYMHARGLLK